MQTLCTRHWPPQIIRKCALLRFVVFYLVDASYRAVPPSRRNNRKHKLFNRAS